MACTCGCHHGAITIGFEGHGLEMRVATLEAELMRRRVQTERRSLEARVARLEAEMRSQGGEQPGPGES